MRICGSIPLRPSERTAVGAGRTSHPYRLAAHLRQRGGGLRRPTSAPGRC